MIKFSILLVALVIAFSDTADARILSCNIDTEVITKGKKYELKHAEEIDPKTQARKKVNYRVTFVEDEASNTMRAKGTGVPAFLTEVTLKLIDEKINPQVKMKWYNALILLKTQLVVVQLISYKDRIEVWIYSMFDRSIRSESEGKNFTPTDFEYKGICE